ncbi:MAG: flagellar hook protein FlgE [Treponema sp.]|nr:flagellar hook protein FlgE [Treponema sp.]
MMRSLFSGVSGLQNHQTRMDVIGNNISNVNTYGFKRNRVSFQDMFYQTLRGAARPTEEVGGVNPQQVGLGMTIAAIDTLHLQGSFQTTGVGTDLAINGTGFFILNDKGTDLFTRAGTFSLDSTGTLVNSSGMQVQGWMAQEIDGTTYLDTARSVENLIIPVGAKDAARATTMVKFSSNLDKRMPEIPDNATDLQMQEGTRRIQQKIYDAFGQTHDLQVEFRRVPGVPNSWTAQVMVNPQSDTPANTSVGLGALPPAAGGPELFTVNFDNLGRLLNAVDAAGNESGEAGQVLMNVAFDVPNAEPDDDGGVVRQTFQLNLGTVGGLVNTITQFAEQSTTKIFELDGNTMGYMENFRIDNNGVIIGVFDNKTTRVLGQIALASFPNQGGLEKVGDNNFRTTTNSGLADIGISGVAGRGSMRAGVLEMSNVDMAEQFTDMIITQRGFQANSRTIQTSDQMLQEILNLR